MARSRPGIRRSHVRSPLLALAQLHKLIDAAQAEALPKPKRFSLRDWFYSHLRSFCARNMKAGL